MTITDKKKLAKEGFSLIEIMIVIGIIGIILGFVGPRIFGAMQRARIATAKTELNTINSKITQFNMDTGQYPKRLRDLVKRPAEPEIASQWQGPYLPKKEVPKDPWNSRYVYKLTPNKEIPYELYSYGPKKRGAPRAEWIRVTPIQ